MSIRNNTGPRREPWGIPKVCKFKLFFYRYWKQLESQLCYQRNTFSSMLSNLPLCYYSNQFSFQTLVSKENCPIQQCTVVLDKLNIYIIFRTFYRDRANKEVNNLDPNTYSAAQRQEFKLFKNNYCKD